MFFRIKLAKSSAEKARNSLASGLYEELFRQIMQYINYNLSTSSSDDISIGILDIAGFGRTKISSLFYFVIQMLSIYAKVCCIPYLNRIFIRTCEYIRSIVY